MLAFLAFLFIFPCHARSADLKPNWWVVHKRLEKAGLKKDFILQLKIHYDSDPFQQVLELNTLLFLKKTDYHGVQVTPDAVDDVRAFMKENEAPLKAAEMKFGVSGSVIASLLWLESRYGQNLGRFHVPSVFVDLVQADQPEVLKHLYKAAKKYTPHVTAHVKSEIRKRALKRVTWAIAELKAVQEMRKMNKDVLGKLRGSFAGAFGMPQFEPSSYVHYAHGYAKSGPPNLSHAEDAIQSVACYLKDSGWKKNKKSTHVKSLLKYNNSHDYANAILKLAKQAGSPGRLPAGKKRRHLHDKMKIKRKRHKKKKKKTSAN